jgi:hypothetical protein
VIGSELVSPLEQYRQKVIGNPLSFYNPIQFTITTGNPIQSVSRSDVGVFFY